MDRRSNNDSGNDINRNNFRTLKSSININKKLVESNGCSRSSSGGSNPCRRSECLPESH